MCEDYPACGHDLNDCPWEEEALTPEQEAAEYRAYLRNAEQEAYAEFLQSPYCFDWGNIFAQNFYNEMVTMVQITTKSN